jgi:hypothetical protein
MAARAWPTILLDASDLKPRGELRVQSDRTRTTIREDLRAALAQLLHEVVEAGFETAHDYNWSKSIADAKAALDRDAHDVAIYGL